MDYSLTISIEKSILSSILFNPKLLEEVIKSIKPIDFFSMAHQEIFKGMLLLHNLDLPIDEEFLNRKCQIDTQTMIEIMAANPISDIMIYLKELKEDSLKRQIEIEAKQVTHGRLQSIDKLAYLKEELENVNNLKKLKSYQHTEKFWDSQDMDVYAVENTKFEYLLDNFMVKNEITMVAARPNLGKSLTAFAITNMVLTNKTISTVFYLDGDNGVTTIKERKIHTIKESWDKNLRYIQGKSSSELNVIIKMLINMDLIDCLVVFDSIKNFMVGGDRDKNKDVSKVMDILKHLRNNGATVIFLHHSNKPQKDVDDMMYAGSSAWGEDTGNAYILKKNEDKESFIFFPIKKRTGELHEQAYGYDSANFCLKKIDLIDAKKTKEDEEMIKETTEYLKSTRNKPMWSELHKNLTELGYDKEKAAKVIKNGEGKLWNYERGDRNNKKLYFLIESATNKKAVYETIYEEISNVAPITQTTPISLFLGTSNEPKKINLNFDNSEKCLNVTPESSIQKIDMPIIL